MAAQHATIYALPHARHLQSVLDNINLTNPYQVVVLDSTMSMQFSSCGVQLRCSKASKLLYFLSCLKAQCAFNHQDMIVRASIAFIRNQ
jgi:hypothetical protein